MVDTATVVDSLDRLSPPVEKSDYVWFRVSVLKKVQSSAPSFEDLQVLYM
jgi:hypothetical protein